MPTFDTAAALSRYIQNRLERTVPRARAVPDELARVGALEMYVHTRDVFGHAGELADLAPSTQAERERLGYTPNDPLLRSGSLRDTYNADHVDGTAIVGSDDPRAKWHEHGYVNARTGTSVPPRPVLLIGLNRTVVTMQPVMRAAARVLIEE